MEEQPEEMVDRWKQMKGTMEYHKPTGKGVKWARGGRYIMTCHQAMRPTDCTFALCPKCAVKVDNAWAQTDGEDREKWMDRLDRRDKFFNTTKCSKDCNHSLETLEKYEGSYLTSRTAYYAKHCSCCCNSWKV